MSEQGPGRKHRASRPQHLRGCMSKNQVDGPPELGETPSSWEGSMALVGGWEPSRGPESQLGD